MNLRIAGSLHSVAVTEEARATPPIACSLDAAQLPDRLTAWEAALASVVARTPLPGGVRLTLSPDAPLAALVELVVAEQACCSFIAFAITVDSRGTAFEVTAPPEAHEVVQALFG